MTSENSTGDFRNDALVGTQYSIELGSNGDSLNSKAISSNNPYYHNNQNYPYPGYPGGLVPGTAIPSIFTTTTTGASAITLTLPASVQDLFEMYLKGKDLETDKEEFLNLILKLPFVDGNQVIAIAVFHKLRKLFDLLTDGPVQKVAPIIENDSKQGA